MLDAFSSRVVVSDGEDRAEVLRTAAEEFLRAGGQVAWEWWAGLGEESRDAFLLAGDRIRQELAGLAGAAAREDTIAQALLSGEDVEVLQIRRVVQKVAAAGVKRLSQEAP